MKRIKYLFLILILSLTACTKNEDIKPNPSDLKPEIITLDKKVTSDMDFFKDGYEIVTVESYGDGDTTVFNLKSGTYNTRYLAIDTPETSNGLDPWGLKAKDYLNDLLKNAKEIVLMKDPALNGQAGEEDSTLDKYGRLLAHVFIDGELAQYKLVNESLAWVKYLYFDYAFNDELIELETYVKREDNRRVHNPNDLDPDYDYENIPLAMEIKDISRDMIGKNITIEGVVTARQGFDFFIENDGKGIFVYAKNLNYKEAIPGNKIKVTGSVATYNGQMQISNLLEKPTLLEENIKIEPKEITFIDLNEENESLRVIFKDLTIQNNSSQNIIAKDKEGKEITIRIDKDNLDLVKPSDLEVGVTYDVTANIGQYNGAFQLMLASKEDLTKK